MAGSGIVKYPGYKTGGRVRTRGLRNKRRSYYHKLHEKENREKKEKEEELKEKKREQRDPYSQYSHYGRREYRR